MNFKVLVGSSLFLLAFNSSAVFAGENVTCPTFTANDIRSVIHDGVIATHQTHTLAEEAMKTPDQVLRDETKSNPFDTYYQMISFKNVDNQNHLIYIGNVLGKDVHEAKHRAKKIVIGSDKTFTGRYDKQSKLCIYKDVTAGDRVDYPFKSSYESVVLMSMALDNSCPRGGDCYKLPNLMNLMKR